MPDLDDAPREVAASLKQNPQNSQSTAGALNGARKTHPMLIIAAGAVTLFSAVGIAMMTGILPSANSIAGVNNGGASKSASIDSKQESSVPLTAAAAGAASAGVGTMMEAPVPAIAPTTAQAPQVQPVESKTVGQPLARADQVMAANRASAGLPTSRSIPTSAPAPVYANRDALPNPTFRNPAPGSSNERGSVQNFEPGNGQPMPVYAQNGSQSTPQPDIRIKPDNPPKVVAAICRSCGRVDSIIPIENVGQGSGAGALLGGLLGGVLGHQVGNGRGRDAATAVGAVGGAVLGNQVERNNNASRSYDVRVRMEDRSFRTVRYEVEPNVRVGDKVRLEGGRLVRN
jgi:outer membrane lipoprotein SlyB